MIKNVSFKGPEIDSILALLVDTYGYKNKFEGAPVAEKIDFLENFYSTQNYPNSVIKTKEGIGTFSLPSEFNGTLFLSEITVNVEVKSLGEKFGVEEFEISKINKNELGLIIIENHMDGATPDLVVIS